MKYPYCDYVWLATDKRQRVAAFVTGGQGPIPSILVESEHLAHIEQRALELPVLSEPKMLRVYKQPDSFIELARRGVFVYDWTDVHKTRVDETSAYELVCAPTSELEKDGLSPLLEGIVDTVGTFAVEFGEHSSIDPRVYTTCIEPVSD